MPFIQKPGDLYWTFHARAKMRFYGLSESRVRRVLHSPKRVEKGVAPKTIAMMQPASVRWTSAAVKTSADKTAGKAGSKREETWTQEIWVMIQDVGKRRKIISAWRYPGKTKPRSEAALDLMRQEYHNYLHKTK